MAHPITSRPMSNRLTRLVLLALAVACSKPAPAPAPAPAPQPQANVPRPGPTNPVTPGQGAPGAQDTTQRQANFPTLPPGQPRPYNRVITAEARTRRGMFAVHRISD